MKERIINKITSAKFLVTIAITGVFCALALEGKIGAEAFTGIAGSVITSYFALKSNNIGDGNNANK